MGKKVDTEDPRILLRRSAIAKETGLLEHEINELLPLRCRLQTEFLSEAFTSIFSSEYAQLTTLREFGGRTSVVPVSTKDWERENFWLSLAIIWTQSGRGSRDTFAYRTAGITIYHGDANDARKIQLIRAEWPGLRYRDEDKSYVFEAPGAGHPHWHVDEPRSHEAIEAAQEEERRRLLAELSGEAPTMVIDSLLANVDPYLGGKSRRYIEWTKIHFAQRAMWHQMARTDLEQWTSLHVHSPTDFAQVKNWLVSTVCYLRNEIARI